MNKFEESNTSGDCKTVEAVLREEFQKRAREGIITPEEAEEAAERVIARNRRNQARRSGANEDENTGEDDDDSWYWDESPVDESYDDPKAERESRYESQAVRNKTRLTGARVLMIVGLWATLSFGIGFAKGVIRHAQNAHGTLGPEEVIQAVLDRTINKSPPPITAKQEAVNKIEILNSMISSKEIIISQMEEKIKAYEEDVQDGVLNRFHGDMNAVLVKKIEAMHKKAEYEAELEAFEKSIYGDKYDQFRSRKRE